ncbi:Protein of unknown function [Cotesia congregata]|uniref:Uncharacterized protein n=1 Tax=Cotesia congregata TaxID=51543 RepID=A0A8J2MC55_COTCN|nr:Protein of unknown function [Cotesia congregata]
MNSYAYLSSKSYFFFNIIFLFTFKTPFKILPPATPPLRSSTSQPGLLTSNDRITIKRGSEVKSRRGTGIFLTMYSQIFTGLFEAPDALNCFDFINNNNKQNLRHNRLLKTSLSNKNYIINGPRNRIANLVNKLHSDGDFFNGTLQSFISRFKCIL